MPRGGSGEPIGVTRHPLIDADVKTALLVSGFGLVSASMQPDPACTVIMTETVKASKLPEYQRQYFPLFIDDNVPQYGLDGSPAYFARKITMIGEHFGNSLGDQEPITVKFADGTPGRVFDPSDDVVVHFILLGTDVLDAGLQR